MAMKILSQNPTNACEVKADLERIHKRDNELSFRAGKTMEYLQEFMPLSEKQGKELMEKLLKLEIPRLRDQHFHKIIDLLPKRGQDVKIVLQGYNVTVTQENCQKIADTIVEFVE